MKLPKLSILAFLILTFGLTSCGVDSVSIPTIDASKAPMKAYAAEIKYQYQIIVAGNKKGSLDDKDIANYLASWDRIVKFCPIAAQLDQKMTDKQRSAYVEANFKYPWFSGGTFLKDGSLDNQNGFYGIAINKSTGKLMADWTNASLMLSVPVAQAEPGNAQVLAFVMALFNSVFVDLDKVVQPEQKMKLGRQIILRMVACYPSLKYSETELMQALQGAAGFGLMETDPVLKSWLGF